MRGTEKQVSWATDIQERFLAIARKNTKTPESFVKILMLEEDSRFWIDNRDADILTVLNAIKAKYRAQIVEIIESRKIRESQNNQRQEEAMATTDTILIQCTPCIAPDVATRQPWEGTTEDYRYEGRPADAIDALNAHFGTQPWTGYIRETNDCTAFMAACAAIRTGELDPMADDMTVPEPPQDTGYVLIHRGAHVIGVITIYAHGTALLAEQARRFESRDPHLAITLAVNIQL